jgi:glutamine synthetase
VNLLDPRDEAHTNMQFLVFLTAVIRAVDLHTDLLRASVASIGNDHRLGANEAPPAIVSIYLGDMLSDILDQLERGQTSATKKGGKLNLGALSLPQIPRHSGDRNRTSPFAFTGNKFEFRAVGASASIAWPNTVLNAIVAESLDYMATQLEKKAGKRPSPTKLEAAVKSLLREVVKKHRRIVFDGDNYCAAWHAEAKKRGLPNLRTAADALPVLKSKTARTLFNKYGILNPRELAARADVYLEKYTTQATIEARTLISMLKREVLPAAIRYQSELAGAVTATEAAGVECEESKAQLEYLLELISDLRGKIQATEMALAHEDGDAEHHAKQVRDDLLPAMEGAREVADTLEQLLPADLWPLPRYSEMLFIK